MISHESESMLSSGQRPGRPQDSRLPDWTSRIRHDLAREICQRDCPCKGEDPAADPMDSKLCIASIPWEDAHRFERLMFEVSESEKHHSFIKDLTRSDEFFQRDPWPCDCREELTQLLRLRFLDYTVLWPDRNYALSQIYEIPPQSSFQVSQTEIQPRYLNQSRSQSWAQSKSISRAQPEPLLQTKHQSLSGIQAIPLSQNQYMPLSQAQSMPLSQAQSMPLSQAQSMPLSQNQYMPLSHAQPMPLSQTLSMPLSQATAPEAEVLKGEVSSEKINKMAAEISQSMRRIPKREEDILRLRHFHSLKERGRSSRPFPQVGQRPKSDVLVHGRES